MVIKFSRRQRSPCFLARRGFSSVRVENEAHKSCLVKAVGISQCLIIIPVSFLVSGICKLVFTGGGYNSHHTQNVLSMCELTVLTAWPYLLLRATCCEERGIVATLRLGQ